MENNKLDKIINIIREEMILLGVLLVNLDSVVLLLPKDRLLDLILL